MRRSIFLGLWYSSCVVEIIALGLLHAVISLMHCIDYQFRRLLFSLMDDCRGNRDDDQLFTVSQSEQVLDTRRHTHENNAYVGKTLDQTIGVYYKKVIQLPGSDCRSVVFLEADQLPYDLYWLRGGNLSSSETNAGNVSDGEIRSDGFRLNTGMPYTPQSHTEIVRILAAADEEARQVYARAIALATQVEIQED